MPAPPESFGPLTTDFVRAYNQIVIRDDHVFDAWTYTMQSYKAGSAWIPRERTGPWVWTRPGCLAVPRKPWLRVYKAVKHISCRGYSELRAGIHTVRAGVSMATVKDANDFTEFEARRAQCSCFNSDYHEFGEARIRAGNIA